MVLGIPGTIASNATVIDGYAKRGLHQTAFGAAFACSAFGGVLSGLAVAASLPIAMWIIVAVGSPESFLLALIGLLMVSAVSGNAVSKEIGAAALGLTLSQIGLSVTSSRSGPDRRGQVVLREPRIEADQAEQCHAVADHLVLAVEVCVLDPDMRAQRTLKERSAAK